VPGVILLQEAQIVIRVVEHDLDGGSLEEMPELRGRADRQRIDDRRALARRELEQIDSVDEAMEARTFGVERDDLRVADRRKKCLDRGRRVEIKRCMHATNLNVTHVARSRG